MRTFKALQSRSVLLFLKSYSDYTLLTLTFWPYCLEFTKSNVLLYSLPDPLTYSKGSFSRERLKFGLVVTLLFCQTFSFMLTLRSYADSTNIARGERYWISARLFIFHWNEKKCWECYIECFSEVEKLP